MKAVKNFSIEGNPVFLVQLFLNTGKVEKKDFLLRILRGYFLGQLSWFFAQETASNQNTQSVSLGRKGSREI